ncbi:tetratricopeptide repeat protein [Nocardia bovistercoris]|uniref:Tetratricopeptide repeat protein n=1 Tax=Nocardia bovistercoris TaxID=2785916 RepID=A0A931N5G3_9NOCA|nr:tetratricopeptide repeat protein [Nocardia bovistercoris]MBH0778643.1 tetratricopeptide repeat protein [Nocardia bovistercoris]
MSEPDDGRAVLLEGAAAYQRGEVAEALRIFERAARTSTGGLRTSALINAASMADELGDHATALGWYREALDEMPADAVEKRVSALVNYSQALQHVGELEQAQAALEQARETLGDGEEFGALRVACLLSLCAVAFHRGQWTRTIEIATESLDAAVRFAPHLAGHPLSNLAGAYFETGHRELAVDFMRQALAAFESALDPNGVAETQQNLATMFLRMDRLDEAEPLLRAGQDYFERAGLGHRAGIGLKTLGFLAEGRGELDSAHDLYRSAHEYFTSSGAVLDAADVRVRLATVAFRRGAVSEGEQLLTEAFRAYAERGLGLHCAQIDYWHATLLESVLEAMPDPGIRTVATNLAVTSAIAIDAVRHTFGNGGQREHWNRAIADPAMRLAFRFAHLSGNGQLLVDLIETQCAGSTLNLVPPEAEPPAQLPLDLLSTTDPVQPDEEGELSAGTDLMAGTASPTANPRAGATALQLGAALAEVAASAGLPVAPPPRVTVGADGHVALAAYIAAAEQRYGRRVRDELMVPT